MIMFKPQQALGIWLCHRIQLVPTRNLIVIANYSEDEKKILGAVGFDNWTTQSVEIHAAGEGNWITRELIWKVFAYAFESGGVKVILARVSSTNQKSLNFCKRFGFEEAARIPDAADDGDLVIMQLRKENCRWLKPLPHMRKEVA